MSLLLLEVFWLQQSWCLDFIASRATFQVLRISSFAPFRWLSSVLSHQRFVPLLVWLSSWLCVFLYFLVPSSTVFWLIIFLFWITGLEDWTVVPSLFLQSGESVCHYSLVHTSSVRSKETQFWIDKVLISLLFLSRVFLRSELALYESSPDPLHNMPFPSIAEFAASKIFDHLEDSPSSPVVRKRKSWGYGKEPGEDSGDEKDGGMQNIIISRSRSVSRSLLLMFKLPFPSSCSF